MYFDKEIFLWHHSANTNITIKIGTVREIVDQTISNCNLGDPQALKLFAEILEHVLKPRDKKNLITEILDVYFTLEETAEDDKTDTEITLKSLIDGYMETLENWMPKPKELENPKPANRGYCYRNGTSIEKNENKRDIDDDETANEIFDEIRRGSCYRNDTNLEFGRRKVDTKNVDEDKEDCRTLVGDDEVFE
ncbi:8059_t:CDS:2, partial [Racocetra fulgida]